MDQYQIPRPKGHTDVRITVIRAVAASALLSAIALSIAGCVNNQQPANPADYPTTSYGNAVVTTTGSTPSESASGTGQSTSGSASPSTTTSTTP
ncbi:MAG TPA: hypothetical protein VF444_01405 [Pseudonocardiaceae bacterium]